MDQQPKILSSARAVAGVVTPNASRYLQQLCKHFAHKLPVIFDERSGQITFSIGECRLGADDGMLRLSLAAPDEVQMMQLQDIVVRHLLRFAFREELDVNWRSDVQG